MMQLHLADGPFLSSLLGLLLGAVALAGYRANKQLLLTREVPGRNDVRAAGSLAYLFIVVLLGLAIGGEPILFLWDCNWRNDLR